MSCGYCGNAHSGNGNGANKLIEFQHNDYEIIISDNDEDQESDCDYEELDDGRSWQPETCKNNVIVSTHPISYIVASMTVLWPTLWSTFSTVSSFDGVFRFLFVLACWSLIFLMFIYIYRVKNDPVRRLLSVWNYISPKFAGVLDMTFNTTGEDDQDWTNKWESRKTIIKSDFL